MQLMYDGGASVEAVEDYFNVISVPVSPVTKFLADWMRAHPDDTDGREMLLALIGSGLPMSARERRQLVADVRAYFYPDRNREAREKREGENWVLENEIRAGMDAGWTRDQVLEMIVNSKLGKSLGITEVETLHQRLKPSRRK